MLRMQAFGFLLVLLLGEILAEEDLESVFRAAGEELEMGFCFGVDYIAVYRITVQGRQLLGNSSDSVSPPEAYRDRIQSSSHVEGLLGLQIVNLQPSDSGIYLRECWHNNTLVNQHKHYLYVCDKEVNDQEIVLLQDGSANLLCNITYSAQDTVTLKWFRETDPEFRTSLILDTKESQEPLKEELKGLLQVRNKGFSLQISGFNLKDKFICLLMNGQQCKAFQNIQLPDSDESEGISVFYGEGEEAVLPCPSHRFSAKEVYWETPSGKVDSRTVVSNKGSMDSQMYISKSVEKGNYSLVISSIEANHTGEYSCVSTFDEMVYYIDICLSIDTDVHHARIGEKVVLTCPSHNSHQVNIQWYHQRHLEMKLLYDSGDPYIEMPADVRDRLHIVNEQHTLIITKLTKNDSGVYWCVGLQDKIEEPEESEAGYTEDEEEEDADTEDDPAWADDYDNSDRCIFKRVTQLKVQSTATVSVKPRIRLVTDPVTEPEPKPESGPLLYAVIGGVAVLVILLVIVTVVVVKRRKARDSRGREPADPSKEPAVSMPLVTPPS